MNVVIDGVRYYVDSWGKGFPLLLLHGFTGSSTGWKRFQPYWEDHSRAIALDIIGHGKSEAPTDLKKYAIEAQANALAALLEKLDIKKTDILGYSMGGRLALTFAVKYPEKVRNLILESSSPGLELESEREARRKQDWQLSECIKEKGIENFVDYWENIPLFESQKRLPASRRTELRSERLNQSPLGLMNSLKGMGTGSQPPWWKELKDLSCPVLLLTGTLDEKFCQLARSMEKEIERSRWISVENGGHAIHVEKPEMFGTIVSKYLSQKG
ncbi:2-succinyl-6-hydroxy-2,4-cyclohexadiene-1-carboxylate synthase [bacterium LRH843]|nr:2-succinyl-6-hydroxy-2,4-cyclohexadiene-1-carboxylate synthase [bacterium LRH843]